MSEESMGVVEPFESIEGIELFIRELIKSVLPVGSIGFRAGTPDLGS